MFSQSELIFRIEIKCAIFKRIIAKRPFASHIFKTQTVIDIVQSIQYVLVILHNLGDPT
jgi:hypothetical protein